jgi:hypothetical protein
MLVGMRSERLFGDMRAELSRAFVGILPVEDDPHDVELTRYDAAAMVY